MKYVGTADILTSEMSTEKNSYFHNILSNNGVPGLVISCITLNSEGTVSQPNTALLFIYKLYEPALLGRNWQIYICRSKGTIDMSQFIALSHGRFDDFLLLVIDRKRNLISIASNSFCKAWSDWLGIDFHINWNPSQSNFKYRYRGITVLVL